MKKALFICLLLNCLLNPMIIAQPDPLPIVMVLGTAQDGGYPHLGCSKDCCIKAWQSDTLEQYVVSLALISPATGQWWLVEATPDILDQLQLFHTKTGWQFPYLPSGILITHAHIGHYTGLMQLGREVMNTKDMPVYVSPRMQQFLQSNGPWSQLVSLGNINPVAIQPGQSFDLSGAFNITPFLVPHRDEYSETAGFSITAGNKNWLFIPDIDKWEKWDKDITQLAKEADHAFLDATFFSADEIPGRNLAEIPHPMVTETMNLFEKENLETRNKVVLIHMNHTNPLLSGPEKRKQVSDYGFRIARQGAIYR